MGLPLQPFTKETEALKQRRYVGLTLTDRIVASIFALLFLAMMLLEAG